MNKSAINNLINGVASEYLHIDDRSIHYGDGLFETILCEDHKLYYWPQHYQRLQVSALQLKMVCPPEQVLLDDITELLSQQESANCCAIKIIISRGIGLRGYAFSKKAKISRLVFLSPLEKDYSSLLSKELLAGELYLCQQQVSINKNLAGLKHLNRLENVMARDEWQAGYIDGLMLNYLQNVIEGTMSNLFAVRGKQLFTPDIELSGVRGVMRDAIIAIAEKNNLSVKIIDIKLDEIFTMDELFISSSLIGMKSVTKLCDATYNKQDVTDIIFNALLAEKEKYAQAV